MNQADAQSTPDTATPDATSSDAVTIKLSDMLRLLRSGGGALFAQAALHGQLARVEWAQERQRLTQLLFITLLGFACLLCLLLAVGAILLAMFWDTPYRILTVLSLISIYGLGTLLAWSRFARVAARSNQAFVGTRQELAADMALLRSRL